MQKEQQSRLLFVDNLKFVVISLAVLMHSAVTYSGMGSWYYKEDPSQGLISLLTFFVFQTFTQAYFMGLMFLLAGYFTAISYDKKGFTTFIKDRLVRLGAPTLLYMIVINPLMYYLIDWHGVRTKNLFLSFYPDYLLSPRFLGGTGPLWFALALLIFSITYALFRKIENTEVHHSQKPFSFSVLVKLIISITISTFIIRLFQHLDTSVYNMQLCYFPQYIILFSFGIYVQRKDWLSSIDYHFAKKCMAAAVIPGILLLLATAYLGGALEGNNSAFKGGFYWQSLAFNFWESTTGVCMSIGLVAWFRQNVNWQNQLLKKLSNSAFSVYVFHPPILVLISLAFQSINLPPISKFLLLAVIALPSSFLMAQILNRIPIFYWSCHPPVHRLSNHSNISG